MIDDNSVLELDKNILVFKNLFPNPIDFIKKTTKKYEWVSWYTFGEQTQLPISSANFNDFPSDNEWSDHLSSTTSEESKIVEKVFFEATKYYVNKTGYTQKNWSHYPPSLCRYDPDFCVDKELDIVMHYHTDYQQEKKDEPGDKFGLTCTIYLNDDYKDGGLSFKVFDENDKDFKLIEYKPESGDVVVFPSAAPYFHAVRTVKENYKYFLRTFWWWNFEGTKEWLANRDKYGEEKWKEMERERHVKGFSSGEWTRN